MPRDPAGSGGPAAEVIAHQRPGPSRAGASRSASFSMLFWCAHAVARDRERSGSPSIPRFYHIGCPVRQLRLATAWGSPRSDPAAVNPPGAGAQPLTAAGTATAEMASSQPRARRLSPRGDPTGRRLADRCAPDQRRSDLRRYLRRAFVMTAPEEIVPRQEFLAPWRRSVQSSAGAWTPSSNSSLPTLLAHFRSRAGEKICPHASCR